MKLLLDQGLPRGTALILRAQGLDVLHVSEIAMARADDLAVLQKAREEGRIAVTLDADFHSALALSGQASPSVIRIRIEGLRADRLAAVLIDVIAETHEALESGSLITVQPYRIRIRRLADIPPRDPS
jgi:predicted nuclease of predicted toxin-antitoxin system